MKKILIVLPLLFATAIGFSQTKTKKCDSLVLNLDKGTLNGLKPTATQQQIKAKLPCFTGVTKDGDAFNCGGGIFYLNHDVFFYTTLDIINVRDEFAGKMTWKGKPLNIWGSTIDEVESIFGANPEISTESDDEENFHVIYKMKWGSLRIEFQGGEVAELIISLKKPALTKACE